MTAAAHPALDALPAARRAILNRLKRSGECRAEALAATLGITASGTRQHLAALERDGLVTHRASTGGRGRPRHHYRLTPAADALYPRTYAELTNELLEYVEDASPELLRALFERRGRRRLERARARIAGQPHFEARVRELARVLDEDGYLADADPQPDGSILITEHNCAVLGVALRYGHACSSELDFLRAALPDAEIERTSHIVAGAHVCAYRVSPRPA